MTSVIPIVLRVSHVFSSEMSSYQMVLPFIPNCCFFVLSASRMVDTSRRGTALETGLNPLEISRRLEEPGMCSWMMIVWHSIYRCRGSAAELLLHVSRWSFDSFRCGQQLELNKCDSSKRINEVAESDGFRGIIAGTCKPTSGIMVLHAQLFWLESDILTDLFVKISAC
jgi:hypothetical protein